MDTHTYPGRGLSLSQLVFALNEELKRVTYPSLFTLEVVSQLDRDASIALATIREWRNSFARVNRIPTDILPLIPTHLPTQKDRFRAASVCRHWRGVLLKHGPLWSQLFLKKGEECVSTLLERAKGSALDVIINRYTPVGTITHISTRAEQILSLKIIHNHWQDIIAFSEFNCGKYPLLRTLSIFSLETFDVPGQPNDVIPPSLPLFRGSIDLENFAFTSWRVSFLNHFVFPNLTTFRLISTSTVECSASCLLNFLKASPMLRTVEMNISARLVLGDVPQGVVVILPNVETFSLVLVNDSTTYIYHIAAHISCPRTRYTSLAHEMFDNHVNADLGVFPTPVLWNVIIHQYMATPIEGVELEIKHTVDEDTNCSLTFQSSNVPVLGLRFNVAYTGRDEEQLPMPHAEMGRKLFSQALTTIQYPPLLSNVKQLRLEYRAAVPNTHEMQRLAEQVPILFRLLGPLDKLTICGCDLHIFLDAFLDHPRFDDSKEPIIFPQIKELAILHPLMETDETECMEAIVKLAESQHALGMPFERVEVRMWSLPVGMADELGRWVGAVHCCEEWYEG